MIWQAMAGVLIDPGEGAQGMKVLVEVGYRGTSVSHEYEQLNNKSYELDMSGLVARVGLTFALGDPDMM